MERELLRWAAGAAVPSAACSHACFVAVAASLAAAVLTEPGRQEQHLISQRQWLASQSSRSWDMFVNLPGLCQQAMLLLDGLSVAGVRSAATTAAISIQSGMRRCVVANLSGAGLKGWRFRVAIAVRVLLQGRSFM